MLPRTLLALLILIAPLAPAHGQPVVREQRNVTIDGVKEVWRLIWRDAPSGKNGCGLTHVDTATTCPCSGAAFAEVGDLVLERDRPGKSPEVMPLAPLFEGSDMLANEEGSVAMLVRWPARLRDIDHPPAPAAIRARRAVPIMRLRDYNHDGIAGEFLLQIDTLPCGKHVLVAIGTTRDNPHLHALTSAEHPERPLALLQWQWDALARSPSPGEVMDWPCDDHGAEEQSSMLLRTDRGGIHATRTTFTCPDTMDANGEWHHDDHFVRKMLSQEVM